MYAEKQSPAIGSALVFFALVLTMTPTARAWPQVNTSILPDILESHAIANRESLRARFPGGSVSTFSLVDSETIPAALAKRFPMIRSMKGMDALGRQIRVDLSPARVRGVVSDGENDWWIDQPRRAGALVLRPIRRMNEKIPSPTWSLEKKGGAFARPWPTGPSIFHEFRIAVATTSGYTAETGANKTESLASVIATINQINLIFERDLGVHLVLAENNDKLIVVDPALDPYKDVVEPTEVSRHLIGETIGNQNFDLGHLFEAGDAGAAEDGGVCDDTKKSDAASGLLSRLYQPPAWNDDFITTVAHEVGHQLGASHSFTGCDSDGETFAEPGSGSTIMSYAGDCYSLDDDPNDPKINVLHTLQDYRDAYFHSTSITEIKSKIATVTCGRKARVTGFPLRIDTGKPPFAGQTLTIPARTPFALTADVRLAPHMASLTYAWDQTDQGQVLPNDAPPYDDGIGPIFRSLPPSSVPTRVFPRLETVLGDMPALKGEVLPMTNRDLHFDLVVRNNSAQAPSIAIAKSKLRVVDTGKAFAVIAPKSGDAARWGSRVGVRWDVAGTDGADIACRAIDVHLSIDGGRNYLAKPIARRIPNTGTARLELPNLRAGTDRARLRLNCADNVFFAVSPSDFTIRE